jgi:hypothetical protein
VFRAVVHSYTHFYVNKLLLEITMAPFPRSSN